MGLFRAVVAMVACVPAAFISWLFWVLNGSRDTGTDPVNTLPFAIPWTAATVALAFFTFVSLIDRDLRDRYSLYALGIAGLLGLVVLVLDQ